MLHAQGEDNPYSLHTMPDTDAAIPSASILLGMPFTSTASSSKLKSESTSKVPSWASTPRLRTMLKCSLQDMFVEGSAKESQILDHLRTQKHEHVIGELELKHYKLENKAMEKQHQHEQHEFCMVQMQMMMSQNQQSMLTWPSTMVQSVNQPSFEGYRLMGKLNDSSLPPGTSSLDSYPV